MWLSVNIKHVNKYNGYLSLYMLIMQEIQTKTSLKDVQILCSLIFSREGGYYHK